MQIWPIMTRNRIPDDSDDRTFGQRSADSLTNGMGSWTFLLNFLVFLIVWTTFNAVFRRWAFDRYPYVFLNLILSCIAAIQAPVIMMSQGRKDEISSARSQEDLRADLETNALVRELRDLVTDQSERIKNLEAVMGKIHVSQQPDRSNHNPSPGRPGGSL